VSPDGQSFLLNVNAPKAGFDIWIADNSSGYATRALIATPANESGAAVSRDGKWIAYESEESGVNQIYVRPFPSIGDGRWQISTAGGRLPRWSRDGRELYFLTAGATISLTLMAVPVLPGTGFLTGSPTTIAQLPPGSRGYDVTPDGRFLINVPVTSEASGGGARQRIVIVQHWLDQLQSRVPSGATRR
jgi:serine/threonine-protein kinase